MTKPTKLSELSLADLNLPTNRNCGSCAYWNPDIYGAPAHFGECKTIRTQGNADSYSGEDIAITQSVFIHNVEASDEGDMLYTRSDFGCSLFTEPAIIEGQACLD